MQFKSAIKLALLQHSHYNIFMVKNIN